MKMRKNFRSLCVVMTALIMTVCMSAVAFAEQTEWKPSENSEKFEGITYGKGMFSAAAKGTEIVINSDGTVTLNVTTKPMTSTKYKKVAFSLTELKASDSATMDAIAATIPVTIGTAEDVYVNPFSGENEGIQTFYWSIFSYTMPVEALEKPVYTAGFNVMKKNDDGTYSDTEEKAVDSIEGKPGKVEVCIYWMLPKGQSSSTVTNVDNMSSRKGVRLFIEVTCEAESQSYTVYKEYVLDTPPYNVNVKTERTRQDFLIASREKEDHSRSSVNPYQFTADEIHSSEMWTWTPAYE